MIAYWGNFDALPDDTHIALETISEHDPFHDIVDNHAACNFSLLSLMTSIGEPHY